MWDTTKKLLEEHIVGLNINLSNGFFNLTPKAQINRWGFKRFLQSKGNRQHKEKATCVVGDTSYLFLR